MLDRYDNCIHLLRNMTYWSVEFENIIACITQITKVTIIGNFQWSWRNLARFIHSSTNSSTSETIHIGDIRSALLIMIADCVSSDH